MNFHFPVNYNFRPPPLLTDCLLLDNKWQASLTHFSFCGTSDLLDANLPHFCLTVEQTLISVVSFPQIALQYNLFLKNRHKTEYYELVHLKVVLPDDS